MPAPPSASLPASLGECVDWLRKHFQPEAARGLSAVYRIDLSGPGGGVLHAHIDDGRLRVAEGAPATADIALRMTAEDFFAILGGRANADMLFMEDRIHVDGDLSLALKMRRLFRRQV